MPVRKHKMIETARLQVKAPRNMNETFFARMFSVHEELRATYQALSSEFQALGEATTERLEALMRHQTEVVRQAEERAARADAERCVDKTLAEKRVAQAEERVAPIRRLQRNAWPKMKNAWPKLKLTRHARCARLNDVSPSW